MKLTYQSILNEAEKCAEKIGVPDLLDEEKSEKYKIYTHKNFSKLIQKIKILFTRFLTLVVLIAKENKMHG